jgi:hypothetical protein
MMVEEALVRKLEINSDLATDSDPFNNASFELPVDPSMGLETSLGLDQQPGLSSNVAESDLANGLLNHDHSISLEQNIDIKDDIKQEMDLAAFPAVPVTSAELTSLLQQEFKPQLFQQEVKPQLQVDNGSVGKGLLQNNQLYQTAALKTLLELNDAARAKKIAEATSRLAAAQQQQQLQQQQDLLLDLQLLQVF